jgi:hypothetical protein
MLLVVKIVAFILVARLGPLGALPPTLTVLQTVAELTHIEGAILPGVLTLAVGLALLVLARVGVTIFEDVCALAMLQALSPLSLVTISILPGMHSIALSLRIPPLPDIGVT